MAIVGISSLQCHFKIFQSLDTIIFFNIEIGISMQRSVSHSKWPPGPIVFIIMWFCVKMWQFYVLDYPLECHFKNIQSLCTIWSNIEVGNSIYRAMLVIQNGRQINILSSIEFIIKWFCVFEWNIVVIM